MSTLSYRAAIKAALSDELARDPDVFVFGEDIAAAGGVFKVTEGLLEQFGGDRVLDTPISEQAIVGTAIGAAMMGLKPVAELMFADFAGVCYDQIANQLAKHRYLTDGQVNLPVTLRLTNGAGLGFGAQHSQTVENWFLNVPGLKLAVPGRPQDAYGLLRAAIQDPNPVLVFEHKALLGAEEDFSEPLEPIPLGVARIVKPGQDVTVVATQLMLGRALAAAAELQGADISVEVIDPRTVSPFDYETIEASVGRTRHLVVVQEGSAPGSWGATLVARVVQNMIEEFDRAPVLLSSDETPIPYAGGLEAAWMPTTDRITDVVKRVVSP